MFPPFKEPDPRLKLEGQGISGVRKFLASAGRKIPNSIINDVLSI